MGDTATSTLEARIRAACDDANYDHAIQLAVEGYGPELFRFVRTLVHDEAAAEDVFAEACVDLWRGVPKMAFRSSFRTWAFTVTRRACFRHLRTPERKRRPLHTTGPLDQLVASVRTETARHLRTAVKDRMTRLREALSPEEQALLSLRVDRKLEWPEIAEVLATDEPLTEAAQRRAAATLRKRFERLTDKLRELARNEGLLDED